MTQEQMLKQIEFMTKLLEESKQKMTYSEAVKKEDRITNAQIILVEDSDITTFEELATYGMETTFLKEQMNKNK
jgi:hypothetical protein